MFEWSNYNNSVHEYSNILESGIDLKGYQLRLNSNLWENPERPVKIMRKNKKYFFMFNWINDWFIKHLIYLVEY
jgi:hypothetical protein